MDKWIRRFRAATPVPGEDKVLIPGDPERAMEIERRATGIPLHEDVVAELANLAAKLGIRPLFENF
jgi:LDH2 family malate/lactate/ureidoglycolate dehydrogenase